MREQFEGAGFQALSDHALGQERGTVAVAQLVATAGLLLSIIVVATVLSVGIARADAAIGVIENEGSLFAVALLLGLIFIGIGGFSLLPPRRRQRH